MKTYISTYCLDKKLALGQVLEKYQKNGITSVELTSGRGYQKDLDSLLAKYKFNYLVHNYFPDSEVPFVLNLSSYDKSIREKSIEHIKKSIDFSKKLGAGFYAFHGGFLYQPSENRNEKTGLLAVNQNVRSIDKSGAFDYFKEGLREVLKYSEVKNIKLLIENPPCPKSHKDKLLFAEAYDFLELFKEFDDVYILLDFGHLKISAHTYGFDCGEFVGKIKEKIAAVHVSDNDGENDQNQPISRDNWIISLIKEYNLAGLYATLEIGNSDINTILEQKKILESIEQEEYI